MTKEVVCTDLPNDSTPDSVLTRKELQLGCWVFLAEMLKKTAWEKAFVANCVVNAITWNGICPGQLLLIVLPLQKVSWEP